MLATLHPLPNPPPSRGRGFKANDDTPQDVKDEINAIYNKVGLGEKKL